VPARGPYSLLPAGIFCDSTCPAIRFLCVLAVLFPWASALSAAPPGAAKTPARTPYDGFRQTVRQSGLIFDGTVTAVQCEFGKGKIPQIYRVSFQIKQGVRGVRTGATLAIREWAGLWSAGTAQAPRYRVGERAFLFLYPPSRAGLTSTVGGRQGKLAIAAGQVSIPLSWMISPGTTPDPAPKTLSAQTSRVSVAWLAQRIAQAGFTPSGRR
jgi:hypothetical protein